MRRELLILLIILIFSCGKGVTKENSIIIVKDFSVTPSHANLYGNIDVTINLPFNLSDNDIKAYIDNKPMYNIFVLDNLILGTVAGNDKAGKFDIILETNNKKYIFKNAFEYENNRYGFDKKVVTVGASYTIGFINMTIKEDDQKYDPFALMAKTAEIYFPQSYIKNDFFNGITISDFEQECSIDYVIKRLFAKLVISIKNVKDQNGKFFLNNLRVSPETKTYNFGVGAARIIDTVEGASVHNNPLIAILENLVYYPNIEFFDALRDPPIGSPFNAALSENPDIIMSVDLFADDIFYYYFAKLMKIPTTSGITETVDIERELETFAKRLKQKNIVAFVADLPDITIMPIFRIIKKKLFMSGISQNRVTQIESGIRELSNRYNEVFYKIVAKYPDVIIPVPFREKIDSFINNPPTINGYQYSLDFFGGIISLDFIHPTRTGYAMIANLFVDSLNSYYGINIQPVDVEDVAKHDSLSVEALQKTGIDFEQCRSNLSDY